MIPDIFDSQWTEEDGSGTVCYIECELNKQIGPYPPGTEFGVINVAYEDGKIYLYEKEEDTIPIWKGKILFDFEELKEGD